MEEYGEVKTNVSLKDYNTYKIGGKTKYLVKPFDVDSLIKLIDFLKINNIKYIVLGKGSNIILPDNDFDGCIILLNNLNDLEITDKKVVAKSGISLNKFVIELINNNLKGLEPLYGIPGTVGGAIISNAGCYGKTISDYIYSVKYIEHGKIYEIKKEDCNFTYRNSIFKNDNNKIIIEATFILDDGNKEELLEYIKEIQTKRISAQPLEYPNAGSVFRNPEGLSSGKLIDDLGLKGYSVGGAYISEKHANFIINKNNASSEDILKLIDIVKNKVKETYKIDLELEQIIVKF